MKLLGIALLAVAALSAQDSGTVEGHVTNPATGYGIAGVTVRLFAPLPPGGAGASYQASTDGSGRFAIAGMKPGTYRSSAEKPGYYPSDDAPLGTIMAIVSGADAVRMELHLTPFVTVRGHVLNIDGSPAARARVRGIGPDEEITDDGGSYAFVNARAGSYLVVAEPAMRTPVKADVRTEVVPTYYPSAVERSQAERVNIDGSGVGGVYDIRLKASPVFRVRGVVINEAGKPAANAVVKLLESGGSRSLSSGSYGFGSNGLGQSRIMVAPGGSLAEASVVTTKDGAFELPAVRPGGWRLQAESEPLAAVEERNIVSGGGRPVDVSSHDVENLEIRLAPPFDLQVSTDWGGQEGFKDALPFAILPLDGQPGPAGFMKSPRRFDEIVPGRYRVLPGDAAPPGTYLASVTLGGREVLGQEVDQLDGSLPMKATFKAGAGSVRGTVEKGNGATAILIPQVLLKDVNAIATIRMIKCGVNEVVEFDNLPPGDYYALAVDRFETRLLSTQNVMAGLATNATSVRVEEGGALSVELRVSRWAW